MRQRISNFLSGIKTTLIRIVLTLAGALFVALATIILLAPNSVREFIEGIPLILRLFVLFAIYLVAGVIVYQEFVVGRSRSIKGLIARGNDGAVTSIEPQIVQDRVTTALSDIQGIEPTMVRVRASRGKALISVGVIVQQSEVKIPDKEREIIQALRQVVEKQLGVRIDGRPTVAVTVTDGPRTGRPAVEKQRDLEISEPAAKLPSAVEIEESSAVPGESEEERAFWDFLKSTAESESDDKSQGK